MAARYDKYDPISGGFRGMLAADITPAADGTYGPVAVSLNSSGKVVVGTAGPSGLVGIMVVNRWKDFPPKTGEIVDIMTSGEIVFEGGSSFDPGIPVYVTPAGVLTDEDEDVSNNPYTQIGWTTHDDRLVVRVAP